jgi:transposase
MRGDERVQGMMFATVVLEDRVPADHPLRAIRRLVDPILGELSPQFEALYSQTGRPSIPPEQLLRALVLQH